MTSILGKAEARLRRRLRVRDEEGFITLQAMAIVIIMLGTMLFIVGAAASSRNAARESREFTEVARGNDQGQARLLNDWNNGYYHPFGVGQPTGGGLTSATNYSASYTLDAAAQTVTLTSTASNGSVTDTTTRTTNTVTYPVRSKLVASSKATSKGVAAGIPAGPPIPGGDQNPLGAWGAAISTSADVSSINGSVMRNGVAGGQWDAYGGSVANAGGAHVVSYSDAVAAPSIPGTGGTFERSQISAYLDERQHNRLMANVVTNNASCAGSQLFSTANLNSFLNTTYFCHKGDATLATPVTRTASPAPVTTVVVKGNLRFDSYLNTGGLNDVHIYVDGNVTFGQMSGTQQFNRVYIYAPNGTCASAAGSTATVQIIGALACRRVKLDASASGNFVDWRKPKNQPASAPYTFTNVEQPSPVYFFEKPGFTDQLTP